MFSLYRFFYHLWLFHSLNAAHFESSNAYNFLIFEQKHQVWVVIFLVRTWGTFWYQTNSDLLKFFDFEFSKPPASVSEAMHVTMLRKVINKWWRRLWRHLSRTLTLNYFFLSVIPDDYRSCRLIQVFCHKYSFVFFYIIMIRLEAW